MGWHYPPGPAEIVREQDGFEQPRQTGGCGDDVRDADRLRLAQVLAVELAALVVDRLEDEGVAELNKAIVQRDALAAASAAEAKRQPSRILGGVEHYDVQGIVRVGVLGIQQLPQGPGFTGELGG